MSAIPSDNNPVEETRRKIRHFLTQQPDDWLRRSQSIVRRDITTYLELCGVNCDSNRFRKVVFNEYKAERIKRGWRLNDPPLWNTSILKPARKRLKKYKRLGQNAIEQVLLEAAQNCDGPAITVLSDFLIALEVQETETCVELPETVETLEDDLSICARCNRQAQSIVEIQEGVCANCGRKGITSYKRKYLCEKCDNSWLEFIRSDDKLERFNGDYLCPRCGRPPQVWCPNCNLLVEGSRYLFVKFGDTSAFHAASLVTHYRHEHLKSWDRAWQNPNYAAKIPSYDYDTNKEEVNNRAKRQLIRAIAKHWREKSLPAGINAIELIRGFISLHSNDEKTVELITKTIKKLE